MALLALAACSSTVWREVDVRRVGYREQVFVVTTGEAFVFEVSAQTADLLEGRAVRWWSFPPAPFTVRENESPDDIARRLGWTPELPEKAPTLIPVANIRYASVAGTTRPVRQSAPFLAGVGAVVLGFVLPERLLTDWLVRWALRCRCCLCRAFPAGKPNKKHRARPS